jgi:hypothetical protein
MTKKQPRTEGEIHRSFLREEKKKAAEIKKKLKKQPKVKSPVIS